MPKTIAPKHNSKPSTTCPLCALSNPKPHCCHCLKTIPEIQSEMAAR